MLCLLLLHNEAGQQVDLARGSGAAATESTSGTSRAKLEDVPSRGVAEEAAPTWRGAGSIEARAVLRMERGREEECRQAVEGART
jgi:hypothetical protein